VKKTYRGVCFVSGRRPTIFVTITFVDHVGVVCWWLFCTFRRVNDEFIQIMETVSENQVVMHLLDYSDVVDTLTMLLDQLERCHKALSDFLEEKRSAFPRFYFIGDDDLLEILGQATNPKVIQNHLKKLDQGIYSVGFSDNTATIEIIQVFFPVCCSCSSHIFAVEGHETGITKPSVGNGCRFFFARFVPWMSKFVFFFFVFFFVFFSVSFVVFVLFASVE